MEYACRRCGYTSKSKGSLRIHFARKKLCRAVKEDVDVQILKDELESISKAPKEYKCEKCEGIYSCRQTLFVHRKKCCKTEQLHEAPSVAPNNDISLQEQVLLLKKEVEMLRKHQQHPAVSNTNNGTVNNITINMTPQNAPLNDFGKESITHLDNNFMKTCLLKTFDGVKDYVNEVHFNPQVPENHNVRFKSTKRKTLEVYKDNAWLEEHYASTLDSMIRCGYKVLFKFFIQHLHTDADFQTYQDQIHTWLSKISTLSGMEYFKLRNDICYIVKNKTLYALTK
jgi:hypothetical protein